MKKILAIILVMIMFTACNSSPVYNKPETGLNIKLNEEFVLYKADMSGYNNMPAFDHQFVGISPDDLINAFETKSTGVFYIGFKKCHFCQEATYFLNEVAKDYDTSIYYMDCYSEQYPLKDKYEKIVEKLASILQTENGEPVLLTPEVVALKDGEIVAHHMGLIPNKDWSKGNPTVDQINELKSYYQVLFESLK